MTSEKRVIVTQPKGIYTLLCPAAFVLVDLQLSVGSRFQLKCDGTR
jgi:hypothetical protein